MVTVFGILNLTEDSFFDESRRLDPAGAVTAAIEMLRVGSDVVDVGPAASHPDARPVSPADEIRRIAPLLDALSDQMHRVSIDSFQPETQRYALKRGVGYLNDIQGFPDPALYPDIAEADCRLVVMHSAQRDGIATRTGHLRPEDALDEIVRFFEARVSALRRSGSLPTGSSSIRDGFEPRTGNIAARAVEPSKAEVGVGASAMVSASRKSFLGATVGLPVKDLVQRALRRNFARSAMALTTSHPRAWRSAKRNHLLGNPREISQSRRQRPRVRSCLAFTFRPPASGPGQVPRRWAQTSLGSSGSNCTMRRRFMPCSSTTKRPKIMRPAPGWSRRRISLFRSARMMLVWRIFIWREPRCVSKSLMLHCTR